MPIDQARVLPQQFIKLGEKNVEYGGEGQERERDNETYCEKWSLQKAFSVSYQGGLREEMEKTDKKGDEKMGTHCSWTVPIIRPSF